MTRNNVAWNIRRERPYYCIYALCKILQFDSWPWFDRCSRNVLVAVSITIIHEFERLVLANNIANNIRARNEFFSPRNIFRICIDLQNEVHQAWRICNILLRRLGRQVGNSREIGKFGPCHTNVSRRLHGQALFIVWYSTANYRIFDWGQSGAAHTDNG